LFGFVQPPGLLVGEGALKDGANVRRLTAAGFLRQLLLLAAFSPAA